MSGWRTSWPGWVGGASPWSRRSPSCGSRWPRWRPTRTPAGGSWRRWRPASTSSARPNGSFGSLRPTSPPLPLRVPWPPSMRSSACPAGWSRPSRLPSAIWWRRSSSSIRRRPSTPFELWSPRKRPAPLSFPWTPSSRCTPSTSCGRRGSSAWPPSWCAASPPTRSSSMPCWAAPSSSRTWRWPPGSSAAAWARWSPWTASSSTP